MKPKSVIVLNALLKGVTVELVKGIPHCLDEKYRLCSIGRKSWFNKFSAAPCYSEECLMLSDYSLDVFIALCNKMSDNEIAIVAANVTLNTINEK